MLIRLKIPRHRSRPPSTATQPPTVHTFIHPHTLPPFKLPLQPQAPFFLLSQFTFRPFRTQLMGRIARLQLINCLKELLDFVS